MFDPTHAGSQPSRYAVRTHVTSISKIAGATQTNRGAEREPARPADAILRYFAGLELDGSPHLLEESYRLRYEVYCLERGFLPAADYPDHLERDAFDSHSVHVGVVNNEGTVVATARLIEMRDANLPVFAHCSLFTAEGQVLDPAWRVAEVSRLSVSRRYNRRAGDEFYGLQGQTPRAGETERRGGGELVLALYRAIYQAAKRHRFTHWIAATERSLQRLFAKYQFPFRAIGPESDYYGMVAPYLLSLRAFDELILSGRVPVLNEFLDGLEPEVRPGEPIAAAAATHEPT
jgi:N-acyl amino acid synthase of PEP-CTERM/exosortase system